MSTCYLNIRNDTIVIKQSFYDINILNCEVFNQVFKILAEINLIYGFQCIFQPFKRQSHKMAKHTQTIRRQIVVWKQTRLLIYIC